MKKIASPCNMSRPFEGGIPKNNRSAKINIEVTKNFRRVKVCPPSPVSKCLKPPLRPTLSQAVITKIQILSKLEKYFEQSK